MNEPGPSILVIEDEPPLQKFLRATLGSQGYQVVESLTGKDGLLQAASRQPDLIILDLGLPDMDRHRCHAATARVVEDPHHRPCRLAARSRTRWWLSTPGGR